MMRQRNTAFALLAAGVFLTPAPVAVAAPLPIPDPPAATVQLVAACMEEKPDLEAIRSLLTKGADPNPRTPDGDPLLLMMAMSPGHREVIRELAARGADLNVRGKLGGTPLGMAVIAADAGQVAFLLGLGADPNAPATGSGDPPLLLATLAAMTGGKTDVLQALLKHPKLDVNKGDKNGETALMRAASVGSAPVIRMLLERGADPRRRRNPPHLNEPATALEIATAQGNSLEAVRLLRAALNGKPLPAAGAAPSGPLTPDERKALNDELFMACLNGDREKAKTLLARGADPNLRHNGQPGLPALLLGPRQAPMLRFILERGANPNVRDEGGKTPLHIASFGNNAEAARLLLEHGANPHAVTPDGPFGGRHTPLHLAAHRGSVETVRLLLAKGARVDVRDQYGATPLAAGAARPDVVQLLLSKGAKVEAADKAGTTPLMEAARYGSAGAVRLLLAKGADPRRRDGIGRTAAQYAAAGVRSPETAALLRKAAGAQ